ncbi:RNA methyltransferase [Armatimonas sp.]|uniref:TrmH family RNA methyltransferase n=1 Tax=Armatimonas sp. TaxID=1872638 RepID=UPI00286AC2D8|nr:RNA methyltransferase [Armatimonas sp.]
MHKCSSLSSFLSPAALERRLCSLTHSREARESQVAFFAEGMRFVAAALANPHTEFECAVIAPELATHPFIATLRQQLRAREIPLYTIPGSLFRRLSIAEEPQGVGIICKQRLQPLGRVSPDAGLCWLALDTIRSPGNLGTICRTADAVGAAGLILIGTSIDPFAPQVIRATMGSLFALRLIRTDEASFARWREKHGVTLVGTSPHATTDYHAFAYPERTVLWLGGEREGLGESQLSVCDQVVHIPMVGTADSLNVATATAILLYEVFNQQRSKLISRHK